MAGIYDFSSTNFAVFEVTTTLYPVDVQDSMIFSANTAEMGMYPVPFDSSEFSFSMGDGSYVQKRWFYEDTVDPISAEFSFSMGDGTYVQKRWFYEEDFGNDKAEFSFAMGDGTYLPKRVFGFAPPEKLEFIANISPEDCSMSGV